MIVSFMPAAPLAERASDDENGWFHDADGALVFVAALIIMAGIAVGAGLGVAALRQKRGMATALVTVPAVIVVSAVAALLTVPSATTFVIPALAASAARALIAPREKSGRGGGFENERLDA